jgi:hypothetical protein
MRRSILSVIFFLSTVCVFAQNSKSKKNNNAISTTEIKIPMQPAYWKYDTATTEFINYKNTEAVKGKNGKGYEIFLKNHIFTNGTIEYDVELSGRISRELISE